ncbi:MAG: helix-turn-helix domain-containing protein [Ruminococcaceae bacterium]|nr:helix-turn-helix domain-containing protein [Oscillospiraceae bacterium]
MQPRYEHHAAIRQNKLSPFFLRVGNSLRNTECNWHKNIEILFIKNGNGHIRYGTYDYSLAKEDLVVVNSGKIHRIYSDDGIDYDCVIIDEQFCKENGLDTSQAYFEELFRNDATQNLFVRLAEQLRKSTENAPPYEVAKNRVFAMELLIDLFEWHTIPDNARPRIEGQTDDSIKKALLFMSENYTRPITLDEIAKAVGLSKFHLEREFKKYTAQTMFTYLNSLRCKHAEICIQNGMTVTEAALENGFETLSYFSRTYKRLMGRSPSRIT